MDTPTSTAEAHGITRTAAIVFGRAAPVVRTVTTLGWTVLAAAAVAWVAGALLHWVEALIIAAALLIAFGLCALLTIGRTRLAVNIDLSPRRVVAGAAAAGRVQVRNVARTRMLPIGLELPIGASAARFELPGLPGGGEHEELFVVNTTHRGVIEVGPATTVRGDPLGLLRRGVSWTGALELCVHPVTVPLESFGSGVLRDLEGQTTNEISMSDLAFHTLRDYAPGDDRRYIHWRSSAKIAAASGTQTFLVRQFLDTRRSHLAVLVDGRADSYTDPEDFEIAISAAASVALRAITDDIDTTVLAAQHAAHEASAPLTLDTFARVTPGGDRLGALAARAARLAPDTSLVLIATGSRTEFADLQRAGSHFAPEASVVVLRIDPAASAGVTTAGRVAVLTVPGLAKLPALLAGTGL